MKFKIGIIALALSFNVTANLWAANGGGDDAGNGGFAYKQSIKILEMATNELEHKIIDSDLPELANHPEWREILQTTLSYNHLQKLYKKNAYRRGRMLEMDYVVNPPSVKVLKPYYVAFSGRTDNELELASKEVQKRLVHEGSHIWGYNEKQSEDFAIKFLNHADKIDVRPTRAMKAGAFCSCLNGQSDLISDCTDFCKTKPVSSTPTLYLTMIIGPEIALNSKLGNLYNWCTVQLESDSTSPQCMLNVNDGFENFNVPVTVSPSSNSLTANISTLSLDKTYLLKIVEAKTGSAAESLEFQLRRKKNVPDDNDPPLMVSPISQYSCFTYGGIVSPNGEIERTSFARTFYYFADAETPAPMPPTSSTSLPIVVCHDEIQHPGNDSALYTRLELIQEFNLLWNKFDPRFLNDESNINRILERRLLTEYNQQVNLNLFSRLGFPNRPGTSSPALGYLMVPFVDKTGKSYCPTSEDFSGPVPFFRILGDYMGETEGFYLAEKEGEIIQDGINGRTIYGTMFATESLLLKYGFIIEKGIKVRANKKSMHANAVYYYWPFNDDMDPLIQGNRKLFTVRNPDEVNGNLPTGIFTNMRTSDKRIGCIPKK